MRQPPSRPDPGGSAGPGADGDAALGAAIVAGPSTAVVAAVINQRPGLIGAAALGSPILDLPRMTDLPGGRSWIPELGSIAQPSDYRALRAVSPYYDLEKSCYPALLVTAGERDDQAHPSHAYKYVAAVQHLETCDAPVHLEVRWGQWYSALGVNAPIRLRSS